LGKNIVIVFNAHFETMHLDSNFSEPLRQRRYLAPEYFMHGIVDEKTDIFAFGVLLLEIVTGRRPIDCSKQSLLQWVSTRERNDTNMMFTRQQFAHMTYSCCLGKATAGSWASD
jgi:hypothetical protein